MRDDRNENSEGERARKREKDRQNVGKGIGQTDWREKALWIRFVRARVYVGVHVSMTVCIPLSYILTTASLA